MTIYNIYGNQTNQNQYDKQQDLTWFWPRNDFDIFPPSKDIYFNQLVYLLWFNNYKKRKNKKIRYIFVYHLLWYKWWMISIWVVVSIWDICQARPHRFAMNLKECKDLAIYFFLGENRHNVIKRYMYICICIIAYYQIGQSKKFSYRIYYSIKVILHQSWVKKMFPWKFIWNTVVPLLSYSCMFQVEICSQQLEIFCPRHCCGD